jgi:hypothetical protein
VPGGLQWRYLPAWATLAGRTLTASLRSAPDAGQAFDYSIDGQRQFKRDRRPATVLGRSGVRTRLAQAVEDGPQTARHGAGVRCWHGSLAFAMEHQRTSGRAVGHTTSDLRPRVNEHGYAVCNHVANGDNGSCARILGGNRLRDSDFIPAIWA